MWVALLTNLLEHIRRLFMLIHLLISFGGKHHLHLSWECLHYFLANSTLLTESKALFRTNSSEKSAVILGSLSVNDQVAFVYVVFILLSWLVVESLIFYFSIIFLKVFQNVLPSSLNPVI
jgi:hypothetical protein